MTTIRLAAHTHKNHNNQNWEAEAALTDQYDLILCLLPDSVLKMVPSGLLHTHKITIAKTEKLKLHSLTIITSFFALYKILYRKRFNQAWCTHTHKIKITKTEKLKLHSLTSMTSCFALCQILYWKRILAARYITTGVVTVKWYL